ncbi:MAG: LrgB family protein [Clostridiaceae bacterium]|nr:LrgB family protein [Clostridiaceae bacterium]
MDILDTPYFGLIISIFFFEIGLAIYKKTKITLLNPLLISIVGVVAVLTIFNIDMAYYNQGGNLILFFLGPATVILAVPLYKQISLLKKNFVPIIAGIIVGSITAIVSVIVLTNIFGINDAVAISLVPKSVTTPIGVEISRQIGGIPAITVGAIVLTGILGAVIGPGVCKIFKIKDEVAVGIAIGTASHALGTTKAMELGETQGAMSSLAIGVAGLITVILAPILINML